MKLELQVSKMNYQILKIKLSQIIECIDHYTSEPSINVLLVEGKTALENDDINVLNYVIKELMFWYQNNIQKICNNQYVTNKEVHVKNVTIIQELFKFVEEEDIDVPKKEKTGSVKIAEDSLGNLMKIIDRFHLVAKQLRNRYNSRETLDINDEYDVQDLFHSLLYIYFNDVRAEEWTPSYAGKCSRQDFLLKNEKIVIEIKKTRKGLSVKELGDQLIIDIARYKSHPDCKTLVCFVYDPEERILNPAGIESDLTSNTEELNTIVKIIQK